MATGGRPTAYVQAKTRVTDNKKKQTAMQRQANAGAGMNIDRGAKDRNNTSLKDLAKQYQAESEAARGTYRLASLRRYVTPQTRYRSNVRTNDGKIGTVKGVGTTYKKKYTTVQGGSTGAQPVDSGNGNSPPVAGIKKGSLKSSGVYGRAQAYLRNRG